MMPSENASSSANVRTGMSATATPAATTTGTTAVGAAAAQAPFDDRFAPYHNGGGHPYMNYAPAPDGQRFLMARNAAGEGDPAAAIAIVLNWAEGLKK